MLQSGGAVRYLLHGRRGVVSMNGCETRRRNVLTGSSTMDARVTPARVGGDDVNKEGEREMRAELAGCMSIIRSDRGRNLRPL